MKLLKQFLFLTLVVIGLSITSMAQKQDDDKKNRPPKDDVKIDAPDKNRPKDNDKPKDNPDNSNKGKKPQAFLVDAENQTLITFV